MAHPGYLLVAAFVAILAISTQQASALQCWSCNNFADYCNEQFDAKKAEADKNSLIECTGRCAKQVKKTTNAGKETVSVNRFCAQTPQIVDTNCKDPANTFCEACDTDKCNGAAQYGPVAVLVVAIPMIIAKTFLF